MRPLHIKSLFLIIPLCLATSHSLATGDSILNKQHAEKIFGMTKSQWNKSVIELTETGAVDSSVNSSGTYVMQLRYANDAYLYVTPKYNSNQDAPDNIAVTLAMPPSMALLFDQADIQKIAAKTQEGMLPEFGVSMTHQSVTGGVALFFVIVAH